MYDMKTRCQVLAILMVIYAASLAYIGRHWLYGIDCGSQLLSLAASFINPKNGHLQTGFKCGPGCI